MKISPARRELYKQEIQSLLIATPRINNIEIARRVGLHRNTVSKLLEEVATEARQKYNERVVTLFYRLKEEAEIRQTELNSLWADSYQSLCDKKPGQLINIVKANWQISKDVHQLHLELLGFGKRKEIFLTQSNIQVNVAAVSQSPHVNSQVK